MIVRVCILAVIGLLFARIDPSLATLVFIDDIAIGFE
jgi:hypothetical protein